MDYVKTDLMPDFDFDAFNHEYNEDGEGYIHPNANTELANADTEPVHANAVTKPVPVMEEAAPAAIVATEVEAEALTSNLSTEPVDKW